MKESDEGAVVKKKNHTSNVGGNTSHREAAFKFTLFQCQLGMGVRSMSACDCDLQVNEQTEINTAQVRPLSPPLLLCHFFEADPEQRQLD